MSETPNLGFGNLIATTFKWSGALFVLLFWGLVVLICAPFATARRMFPFSQRMIRSLVAVVRIRVKAAGLENVDPDRGYVYMLNHSSFLDPFVFGSVVPQFVIGVEKASNFKIPVYGWLIRWWGNVPIVRENREQAIAAIDKARSRLEAGTSIGISPEGTRSKDGLLGPFKKGAFHLAMEAGAQIVPVSLEGVHQLNPDRKFRLVSGTARVTFHPPIDTTGRQMTDVMSEVRERLLSVESLESR